MDRKSVESTTQQQPEQGQPRRERSEKEHPEEQRERLFRGRIFGGDAALWIIIVTLAIGSLLVVYSSTNSLAYSKRHGDTSYYVLNQLRFILAGFFAIFIIHRFDYQAYSRYTRLLLLLSLGLMAMTFFIGVSTNEAVRSLRVAGVTFQPADFLKVTVIMVLAKELAKRQKEINSSQLLPRFYLLARMTDRQRARLREKNREVLHETTMPLLLPIFLACGMIFVSNFSTAMLLFGSCMVMLYVGRVRMSEIWRLLRITVVAVAVVVAVMYAFGAGRSGVWVDRVKSFVGVEKTEGMTSEQRDARDRNEHQVLNAKMAIASGGAIGRGPGHSSQRSNLPLPFSDYAYAFIVEEYGIAGATVVLFLYLWLFFRTIAIFRKCERMFPRLLVLGLGITITTQAFISMLVAVDLFPVTGLPLPYISLGGSSVIFTSIALGMILGVSRQMQEETINEGE